MGNSWSQPVSADEAHARASGRRCYHAQRRRQAEARRQQVKAWFERWQHLPDVQRRLAGAFAVHPSTISRDLARLRAAHLLDLTACPTCGRPEA